MKKANCDIRAEIKNAGLKIWEIADEFGMQDSNFCRKLRKELSENEKQKVRFVIEKLQREDLKDVAN